MRKLLDKYYVIENFQGYIVDFAVYKYEEDLDPLFIGTIKWDGCSYWNFTSNYYPLYFDSKNAAKDFGLLLASLYDWAGELMPEHKECLGDNKYL